MTTRHHRHHLALAGMMIDAVAMVVIVVSPMHGIVDTATWFRVVHLVLVDIMSMNIHGRDSRVGARVGRVHALRPGGTAAHIRKTSSLLNLLFCLKNALLKHLGNSKMLKNT
jgi:hypothetical protein